MIERVLHAGKKIIRMPGVRPILNATGLVGASRRVYNKKLIEKGRHTATFLGEPLHFSIAAEREITRLDAEFSEAEYLGRLVDAVKPGDVMLDIGANIGIWTLVAAAKRGEDGTRFIAFEPDPVNFGQLSSNIEMNGFGGIARAEQLAMGETAGEFELFLGGEAGSGTHTLKAERAPTGDSVKVQALRADDYCDQNDLRPDVVKIDVEGFELSVLRGMTTLLERGAPREFFIEVHTGGIEPVTEAEVDEILSPHGYTTAWRRVRTNEVHMHLVRRE